VLWAGLKGAVPILLGTFLSVIVQGGLVPAVAARLRVPMRTVEPEPWTLGVRFRRGPRGLRRHLVAASSPADGCTIGELAVGEDVWIGLVIHDGQPVPVQGSTRLRAGDEILALADPERAPDLTPIFTGKQGPNDADPMSS
jgi:cell volume regulation protein A